MSDEIKAPVKLTEVSLERGSLISISIASIDATGLLFHLLTISGIAAGAATAINQFQQAIIFYPRAKRHFPQLLADLKDRLKRVAVTVLERKKVENLNIAIETRPEPQVVSETGQALGELSSEIKPGEGEKIDDS